MRSIICGVMLLFSESAMAGSAEIAKRVNESFDRSGFAKGSIWAMAMQLGITQPRAGQTPIQAFASMKRDVSTLARSPGGAVKLQELQRYILRSTAPHVR